MWITPFQYNITCDLFDKIKLYGDKGNVWVKKSFVFNEEVIDYFHNTFYIPTIETLSFHHAHVIIFG